MTFAEKIKVLRARGVLCQACKERQSCVVTGTSAFSPCSVYAVESLVSEDDADEVISSGVTRPTSFWESFRAT